MILISLYIALIVFFLAGLAYAAYCLATNKRDPWNDSWSRQQDVPFTLALEGAVIPPRRSLEDTFARCEDTLTRSDRVHAEIQALLAAGHAPA